MPLRRNVYDTAIEKVDGWFSYQKLHNSCCQDDFTLTDRCFHWSLWAGKQTLKVLWTGFHPAGCCLWFDKETVAFTHSLWLKRQDFETEFVRENSTVCVCIQHVWECVYEQYVCKVACPLDKLKRLPDHKHQPLQNPIILLELASSKSFSALYCIRRKIILHLCIMQKPIISIFVQKC